MSYRKGFTFRTTFASYKVTHIVGNGGSGVVYAVEDDDKNAHALKVLDISKASTARLKRFKNEIHFCSRQRHKNIVLVTDHGITGADEPFYVMNLYSGTLRTLLARGIEPGRILQYFDQLLDGLEAAHLQGVNHRDVKPENVLSEESTGNLVLADFGVAHFEEEDLLTAVETRNQERLANFLYAAPEQRIRGGMVDARADIYALGLILNEMFTGSVPHGTGFRRIADVVPQFAYLDAITDSMLRQDPQQRPESIESIKRELIARGNEFVAIQKLNRLRTEVIPEIDADDPAIKEPIQIVGADYKNGHLVFTLNKTPPPNWIMAFRQPRSNHSFFLGKKPSNFVFDRNIASISLDHYDAQRLLEYAKSYVELANKQYAEDVASVLRKRLADEREHLRQRVAEEERRAKILAGLKL